MRNGWSRLSVTLSVRCLRVSRVPHYWLSQVKIRTSFRRDRYVYLAVAVEVVIVIVVLPGLEFDGNGGLVFWLLARLFLHTAL